MNANPPPPETPAYEAEAVAQLARPPRWWAWLVEELKEDPAHAITLAYLSISVLGVWGSYWFFKSFGVAILDYMSPSDYLTAGLRDPSNIVVVVFAYFMAQWVSWPHRVWLRDPAGYPAFRMGSRIKRMLLPENPDRFAGWMRRKIGWGGFTAIGAVMYGVLTLSLCSSMVVAVNKAESVRRGGGHSVRVTFAGAQSPEPGTARMLGAVGDFVFLYWPDTKRAEAVSLESAARIESVRRQAAPASTSASTQGSATSQRSGDNAKAKSVP